MYVYLDIIDNEVLGLIESPDPIEGLVALPEGKTLDELHGMLWDGASFSHATETLEEEVREERNNLLKSSDEKLMKLLDQATSWSDFATQRAAWKTYRQALRDVPTQTGFPSNVTWPTEPT